MRDEKRPTRMLEDSEDDEADSEDEQLQEAFARGEIKPGLNVPVQPEKFTRGFLNKAGIESKLEEFKLDLPWIETLSCVNDVAPLAPEQAAKILAVEQKRENQLKNNRKLPQVDPKDDPVINDFKRELTFQRQAQSTVMQAVLKLKIIKMPIIRPDDYFAEMAKSDEHMQKIRSKLMQQQEQQARSERVKQLRKQRTEGKAMVIQTKLKREEEKREMLSQLKKVRKGTSKDLGFLDGKKPKKKSEEKRRMRDQKFGKGGKKKGMKRNTKESCENFDEVKGKGKKGGKFAGKGSKRLGKSKRISKKGKR